MGCIITALYIFSMIYVIATWIEFSRAYVFATSFRARYDLMNSSALWEIMSMTAIALNLIIADCTIVRVVYPTGITTHNGFLLDLALLGCMGPRLESINRSNFLRYRRDRYVAVSMSSSKYLLPFAVCGANGVIYQFMVSLTSETGINWGVATMANNFRH